MTLVAFSTGRPTVRSKVPSGAKRELAFVDGRTSGRNRRSGHRTPARAVRADNAAVEPSDGRLIQDIAEGLPFLLVIHIARDEPALPIHLAVVQADALLAGIWIDELRRRAGIKVQRIEPVA